MRTRHRVRMALEEAAPSTDRFLQNNTYQGSLAARTLAVCAAR